MITNNFDDKKDYMITSQKYHAPPYNWSEGIFQRYKPVSGEFIIGDNFYGNLQCVNNQTGRAYHANPCGYWDNAKNQFDEGTIKNINSGGAYFPINKIGNDVMVRPSDRVVFGYARIGEEYKSR